jgi:hypothetical protein
MHQLLIEKYLLESATVFSKGRKWRELDQTMKEREF